MFVLCLLYVFMFECVFLFPFLIPVLLLCMVSRLSVGVGSCVGVESCVGLGNLWKETVVLGGNPQWVPCGKLGWVRRVVRPLVVVVAVFPFPLPYPQKLHPLSLLPSSSATLQACTSEDVFSSTPSQ